MCIIAPARSTAVASESGMRSLSRATGCLQREAGCDSETRPPTASSRFETRTGTLAELPSHRRAEDCCAVCLLLRNHFPAVNTHQTVTRQHQQMSTARGRTSDATASKRENLGSSSPKLRLRFFFFSFALPSSCRERSLFLRFKILSATEEPAAAFEAGGGDDAWSSDMLQVAQQRQPNTQAA